MFSITFNQKDFISVVFDEMSEEIKDIVIDIVVDAFPECKYYIFKYEGAGLDDLIEDIESEYRKLVLKNQPQFYIFSKYMEDIELFKRKHRNFQEVKMYVVGENIQIDFFDLLDINHPTEIMLEKFHKYTVLKIETGSEYKGFKIYCDNFQKISLIANRIEKYIKNFDTTKN